jgi:putative colanic acid biosynthesis glycosyltransferase WcaI
MRPLQVLLLNQYFPPDTAATANSAALVAEALAERHYVTVLAGRPSYDPMDRHPLYFFRRQQQDKLVIERVGSTTFSRLGMKGRLANYLSYLALAVPRALSITPDVVLAMTDPPMAGIIGASIAKFLGRPFVYNVRDLYPEMALAGGILRPGVWTDAWEDSHRRALRQAARIIVLGEDMRERIIDKDVDASRVTIIRDAVPFPELLPPVNQAVVREIRGGFRFVIVHAGNLGFSGAWHTLIHAAEMLESEGVGLVFIGEGAMKSQVEEAAQKCRNIRFLPFRPASEIAALMAAGDLHVVTIRRGLEGVVVPSKLYNILAYGRPILALATKRAEVARLVQQYECGTAVDPDDATGVCQAVQCLLDTPERLEYMSRQARELAKTYNRFAELRKFVDAIEEVEPH